MSGANTGVLIERARPDRLRLHATGWRMDLVPARDERDTRCPLSLWALPGVGGRSVLVTLEQLRRMVRARGWRLDERIG